MSECLWAKRDKSGREYPLVAHLVDTAAVAQVLMDQWVPTSLRGRLDGLAGGDAAQLVMSSAALHDLGKSSPVFQGQLLGRRQLPEVMDTLAGVGLVMSDAMKRDVQSCDGDPFVRRHEVATAALLGGELMDAGADGLGAVVAGHHGLWRIPEGDETFATEQFYDAFLGGSGGWASAAADVRGQVEAATGADGSLGWDRASVVPVLTALVCLADWLASDLADSELGRTFDGDWSALFGERLTLMQGRVAGLLGRPVRPAVSFKQVFGFEPSRPVQQEMVRPGAGGGLRLVMVPTGEGKTEAALGWWLEHAADGQGLYFALPSMATADAMWERVRDFFGAASAPTLGSLLHGRSMLNEFYQPAAADLSTGALVPEDGGLVASAWFQGRHRSLLAPVSVGTADQLLLGVLSHKFGFMRLLGAATKTVVFDEIHSYDPYMQRLLEAFLAWAGELHVDVMLLSATLPQEQARRYVAAYQGEGAAELGEVGYPSVVTAPPDGGGLRNVTLGQSGREQTVGLQYVDESVAAVVARVRELVTKFPGVRVGVIVNTVKRCQQLGEALADLSPLVLHSRFPSVLKTERTTEVLDRFGKGSEDRGGLLIATQIVEQSVDIDVDVLVSDVCPMPSLLQRFGRMWRHERPRPAGVTGPVCHVAHPDPMPRDDVFAFLPYPAAVVLATWQRSLDAGARTRVVVPDDVQHLVDVSHVSLESLTSGADGLVEHHVSDSIARMVSADRQLIPTPVQLARSPALELSNFATTGTDERLSTRWDDQASRDVLLIGDERGMWPSLDEVPADRADVTAALGCTVRLRGGEVWGLPSAEAVDDRWGQQPLLRDLAPLVVANSDYRLDPVLGVVSEAR